MTTCSFIMHDRIEESTIAEERQKGNALTFGVSFCEKYNLLHRRAGGIIGSGQHQEEKNDRNAISKPGACYRIEKYNNTLQRKIQRCNDPLKTI